MLKWNPTWLDARKFLFRNSHIKLEGMNVAGSIKLKTATYLLDDLQKSGKIRRGSTIIESSSGNLGIALSILCKNRGHKFICVTDPNSSPISEEIMKFYGAHVAKVTNKDPNGGYLATRINLIREMTSKNPNIVWTNQYASPSNVKAHYQTTAKEIYQRFSDLDYLFIGAGTTGTLVGCATFFKKFSPSTKIIAVDSTGSVTFGGQSAPRYIPGIGTSRQPEILSMDNIYDVLTIPESQGVIECNRLLREFGVFLGGSSGSVICAARRYLNAKRGAKSVIISPDFGDKYKATIYNKEWVEEKFGPVVAKNVV